MAFSLTWMPAVLLEAGLKVAEVPGWQGRGRAEMGTVLGVMVQHSLFEKEKLVELEGIRTRVEVARAQAEVLRAAFASAKINIVGGDGAFFERFMKAVTLGQSVDGVMEQSSTVKNLFEDYMTRPSGSPAPTLTDLLGRLIAGSSDPESKKKVQALADKARELGLDELAQSSRPPRA